MAGGLPVEVVWLLGPDAVRRYEALDTSSEPPTCRALTAAGYVAMRDGWHATGDHLLFDAGPHGAARCRWGHAHADALSIAVTVGGRPLIVDPGTGSYTEARTRERLRSTFAHSTAWIAGREQAEPGRTFEWRTAADARLERWLVTEAFALAEGSHDGYGHAGLSIRHRRRVVYWNSRGWLVRDVFEGTGLRQITIQFVLAATPDAITERPLGLEVPGGSLGMLLPSDARNVTSSVAPFARSERYGSRSPGAACRVSFEAHLPAVAVTVIRADVPAPSLRPNGSGGEPGAFHDAARGDAFFISGPDDAGGEGVLSWRHEATRATLMINGTNATLDGRPLPVSANWAR